MGNVQDLTGKRFNKLVVLKRDFNASKKKGVCWICKCDCGNITSVQGSKLKSGHTKSCGCLKKVNIIGQRYGRLVVQREDPDNKKKCICICDCGNTTSVFKNSLRRGLTRSCGCLHTEVVSKVRNDLTGKTFGRLTVIKRVPNNKNKIQYLCQCECGNTTIVASPSLINGNTKSCGCLKSELSSLRFTNELTGKKFGKLTVLHRHGTVVGDDGGQYATWLCRCDCGTTKVVRGANLVAGKTTTCGCSASKAELKIRQILNKKNICFDTQYTFDDLRGSRGGKLRFDFAILKDEKLIALIEYQGIQHYEERSQNFGRMEREVTDKEKEKYCLNNNIPLFQIPYNVNLEEAIENILSKIHY